MTARVRVRSLYIGAPGLGFVHGRRGEAPAEAGLLPSRRAAGRTPGPYDPPVTPEGRRLLAAGREAEIYEHDAGRVLRLAHSADMRPQLERECVALRAAQRLGAAVPAVHGGLVEVDGRPGLVLDRVDGGDLLATIEARPWLVGSVARTLASLHVQIN